ncbi:MAG: hypothetical protein ABI624_13075 [Casimicrobiaceae bacterium]
METMTAHEAQRRYPAATRAAPRRAYGATVVAGLYVLLVLGAPLIVRYGPDLEAANVPAIVAAQDTAGARCAAKHAAGCMVDIPIVRQ